MRRKTIKLREFPLGGAKVNSTYIGPFLQTYFVIGDSANNIRLYTFESEQEIQVYNNHNNQSAQTEVTAVALSCLEKEIFSGSNRGMINVWDMETAKSNAPLKGHTTAVNCFGIYPEQPSRLASGSYDTTVKLWDIRQKNCNATLRGHSKPINSIAISPDGNMLLSGSQDNTARLWQLRMPQRQVYVTNEHNGPIIKVKFNHQDCMFATCSADKTAKYFRCQQKCYGFASSTEMVATPVTAIGFSDDGKTLFSAANDVLKSWNMYKSGLLLQSFETNWKGVQQMTMIKEALMAIAFSGNNLSLWLCDVAGKIKNSSRIYGEQSSFVLPKINVKNNGKEKNEFNLNELQNIVGMAVQKVNNIEDKPTRDIDKRQQFQKRKQEMDRKREQMERKKQQQLQRKKQMEEQRERQKQKLLLEQLLRQKQQRQKKQLERLRKLDQQKREQERLYQERIEREKAMQKKVMQTFEHQNNFQNTIQNDVLQDSTLMNISTYVADGAQKQKLKQVELIGQILKDSSKYQSVLKQRMSAIKPIINFWKMGRISTALDLITQSSFVIMIDTTSAILNTPLFKQAITPEVGIALTSCLGEVMATNKHSTYIRSSMDNINTIVLLFKEQLIKIKTFNPITRVDISRQQRLAKYDKLIDQFLNVFRKERLRKYYERKKAGDEDNLCISAFTLYKNLEEVLIKIMPKQQPELA